MLAFSARKAAFSVRTAPSTPLAASWLETVFCSCATFSRASSRSAVSSWTLWINWRIVRTSSRSPSAAEQKMSDAANASTEAVAQSTITDAVLRKRSTRGRRRESTSDSA
eukprot:CAMPEP_0181172450 /NCGR_PEP_ID=MMETSP1096-20121128/2455_1 /TAXON_ID=156174 ORGANISM="Chrysochromulina ericina, Strain CCMP281" /NCGR_SAMPLE_ID=MMETSP1096 /ASSEMBLY_ACC=CAM_ASM_000453 /LENGTH=109 /DNA_ID=CAMNT_0023260177 /DNA_START=535 /DNA_END=864 /DNA_ORIENTATION=-